MQRIGWHRLMTAFLLVCLGFGPLLGWSQEGEAPAKEEAPATTEADTKSAAERQREMAARYRQFDRTLQKMADYLRKTDPEKADLLVRAIRESREKRISDQMTRVVTLLESKQFGPATDRQDDVLVSMQALLRLLSSDGILDSNRAEQERIKDLLKDLGKLLGKEKDLRAKTERGEEANRLADAQAKV
ncbi:MAG: hypothetical protein KDA84_14845, partial [Planctomycetaceae bacterium]|nr:hypothetical protein [Planctomycetaceae bacterium]